MARPLIFVPISLLLLLFTLSFSNPSPIEKSSKHDLTEKSQNITKSSLPRSAHTVLNKYGFPIGLLPTNVLTYNLNHTTGDFSVHLDDTCRLTLPPDNYLATYSKRITGKIVENRIADLDGIRVRAFFQWWGITGIRSNGDDLVFEVGMVTAKYPSKNFDETPECQGKHAAS